MLHARLDRQGALAEPVARKGEKKERSARRRRRSGTFDSAGAASNGRLKLSDFRAANTTQQIVDLR